MLLNFTLSLATSYGRPGASLQVFQRLHIQPGPAAGAWEQSAAESCLIHAGTVSLFQGVVDFRSMLKLSHLDHFR